MLFLWNRATASSSPRLPPLEILVPNSIVTLIRRSLYLQHLNLNLSVVWNNWKAHKCVTQEQHILSSAPGCQRSLPGSDDMAQLQHLPPHLAQDVLKWILSCDWNRWNSTRQVLTSDRPGDHRQCFPLLTRGTTDHEASHPIPQCTRYRFVSLRYNPIWLPNNLSFIDFDEMQLRRSYIPTTLGQGVVGLSAMVYDKA